jgi:predicted anti-sigma-YlaC factor YlaD
MSEPVIPGGISCREVVEIVTDYLEGALAPQEVDRLEVHLGVCGPCRVYLEQIRTTARLAAAAEAEQLERHPDREALLAAFRAFRGDPGG